MSSSDSRSSSIMSIAEVIDSAFGLPQENTVNHKLIQAVLFILARQLKVLERQVEIIGPPISPSSSTLSITEVKLQAKKKALTSRLSGIGVAGIKSTRPKGLPDGRTLRGGIRGKKMTIKTDATDFAEPYIEEEEEEELQKVIKALDEKKRKAQEKQKFTGEEQIVKPVTKTKVKESTEVLDETEEEEIGKDEKEKQKDDQKAKHHDLASSKILSPSILGEGAAIETRTNIKKTDADYKSSSQKPSSDKKITDELFPDKTQIEVSTPHKISKDKSRDLEKSDSVLRAADTASLQKVHSAEKDKISGQQTQSVDQFPVPESSAIDKSLAKQTSTPTKPEKISLIQTSSTDKISTKQLPSRESSFSQGVTSREKEEKIISKSLSDKVAADKISSVRRTLSSDKMVSERTPSSLQETPSKEETYMQATSPSDKSTAEHTSSGKTSTQPTKSSDKSPEKSRGRTATTDTKKEKILPLEQSASASKLEPSSQKTSAQNKKEKYSKKKGGIDHELLQALEEKREAVLRIIHQRADSREERDKTPTPMASLDSVEATYEKLLVVERVSSKEARERAALARKGRTDKIPRLSVVTQEEFDALEETVREIQLKYNEIGKPELPENVQLMQELRKGASLTDAMGALQLSARLEAAEKTLNNLMNLVTELAMNTPGEDLSQVVGDEVEVIYGAPGGKTKTPTASPAKAPMRPGTAKPISKKSDKSKKGSLYGGNTSSKESMDIQLSKPLSLDKISGLISNAPTVVTQVEKDHVNFFELDEALQKVHDQIMQAVNENKSNNTTFAEKIIKQVKRLEDRLSTSLELGNRMDVLEALVAQYAEKINILDTGLSSQMTSYQEELTQMQHDLETGLDTMAEVLANAGTDTTAVSELNTHFSNLQADIDHTIYLQKDLQDAQEVFAYNLLDLRKQIETLRDEKSDRDEVADALRDKAGLSELNGLVSTEQFDAVRGDFEKRILLAYDKFNNQETLWQKIIDDLIRDLHEKADQVQVQSLQDEITKNVNNLNDKINAMLEIVGEPSASALSRKLHRDEACLSCATPAHLEAKTPKVRALPGLRPPAIGAEAPRPRDDGDHGICYPGKPIPHPIDPRAHICKRWCGGSHTAIPASQSRAPAGITISTIVKPETTTTVGTDGKVYQTDETSKKPCSPCYIHPAPQPEPEQAKEAGDAESVTPMTGECTCFPACGLWYR